MMLLVRLVVLVGLADHPQCATVSLLEMAHGCDLIARAFKATMLILIT